MTVSSGLNFRLRQLDKAIADNPKDPHLYYEKAKLFIAQEDWHQVQRLLETAVKLDPHFYQARFELGLAYTKLRNFDTAIKEWEKIVDPDGDLVLNKLDYQRTGPIHGARQTWKEVTEKLKVQVTQYKPTSTDVINLYKAGFAWLVLGDLDLALECFNHVIAAAGPQLENVLYYKGQVFLKAKQFSLYFNNQETPSTYTGNASSIPLKQRREKDLLESAAKCFQKLLEYRPRDPRANYNLGACLLELGHTAKAISYLQKTITDRPGHLKAHLVLATAYSNLLQFDQSIDHLQQALKIEPHRPDTHYKLGRCYEKQYRIEEATAEYEKALEYDPSHKEAHLALGLLYRNLGRHEDALHHLNRVTELDPDEADAYYYMGLTLSALNRHQQAIAPLTKAIKLSPNNAFANYSLGLAYLKCEGQEEQAVSCFQQALKINPRDTKSMTAIGIAYFQRKELTLAKRAFEKVIEINPNEPLAHYYLGSCKFKLNDYGGALQSYQKAAQINPNSALRFFSVGAYHSYNRNYEKALEAFQEATNLRPDSESDLEMFANLQLLATVGITHAQTGLELQRFAQQREEFFRDFILALSNLLDARDWYTQYHSKRVAAIGTLLASKGLRRLAERGLVDEEEAYLPPEMIEGIFYGGLLHDIGKIGIPDNVLNKPGKLTDEEYELIKKHPVIGWEGLKQVEFPWPEVMPIVRHHHEKWNGRGYPDGKKGHDIPFEAQLIGVADFYDALTTHRPYREALSPHKALTIMQQEADRIFNPLLVEAFELILDDVILELPDPPRLHEKDEFYVPEKDTVLDNFLDELRISWDYYAS